MRSLIVTRTKNMQGCLNDVVLYIEDNVNGRIVIQGVNCRKLGVVKNGETVRFSVDDAAARLFGAVWSAPFDCCDSIELPFGNWPVYVSGSVSSAGNSAVFLFDSSRNKGSVESVVKEKSTRTFALVFLVTLSLIALLSVFSAIQGIAHVGVAVFVWIAAIVGWACFFKWDKGNKRKKSSAEPARSEPAAASPVLPLTEAQKAPAAPSATATTPVSAAPTAPIVTPTTPAPPATASANRPLPAAPSASAATPSPSATASANRPLPAVAKAPAAPAAPAIVFCKSCGKQLKNDKSVSRMGKFYYCDPCCEKLLKRYYDHISDPRAPYLEVLLRQLIEIEAKKRKQLEIIAERKRRQLAGTRLVYVLNNILQYIVDQGKAANFLCDCCGARIYNDELLIYNDMLLCPECFEKKTKG